jgi:hypothetical protein
MNEIKVGDELAIGNRWYQYEIRRVAKISPKGFITMSNGDVLNPNLSIRGGCRDSLSLRPGSYETVTQSVRDAMWRVRHLSRVQGKNWDSISDDQLRRIVAILDEGK